MPDRYLKKNLNVISKVIEQGSKASKIKLNKEGLEFIRQFYLHVPNDFLAKSNKEYLYAAAANMWEFISSRKKQTPRKVRVFNPTIEKDGWESERTIVEFNKADTPFILDSITSELTGKSYRIYEVMHPVMRLERDGANKITDIFDKKDESKGHLESVMHFQITHISDADELKSLQKDIENSLYYVDLSVKDWKPMLAKAGEIVKSLDNNPVPFDEEYVQEVKDFLNWCINNNFIMLGYIDYSFGSKGKNFTPSCIKPVEGSTLGIFKAKNDEEKPLGLHALPPTSLEHLQEKTLLEITKSNRKSIIHRPVHMDYIGIKKFDKDGNVIGEHRILGLFTSAAYYQSATYIPIIRMKIEHVIARSGFAPDGHNGKALLTVLESYPRDELLQISEDELFYIAMGIVELSERPNTKLFVRRDIFSRFISCIVFIPRERFNTSLRKKVQNLLESSFNAKVTAYYTQVTESPLARVHVMLQLDEAGDGDTDIDAVERELIEITNSWVNGVRETILNRLGEQEGERVFNDYVEAFPEAFKDLYHFGGTFRDIMKIEAAYSNNELELDLDLYKLEKDDDYSYQLKLYHPETQVTLSDILPILENMGFYAVDEHTFFVQPAHKENGVWIHHFRLKINNVSSEDNQNAPLDYIKSEFEQALFKVWNQNIEDDSLNELIVLASCKWRDVILLRAYSKYILQVGFAYSHEYIATVMSKHPKIVKMLIDLFYARFSPKLKINERAERQKEIVKNINNALLKVESISEDKVIKQFFETILATLRTNYFQSDIDGNDKPYISFKLNSKLVPNLPLPHPHAEIFVYSRDVEGIHLRGGKVARGGLRWSDRLEDFRTEVLGLVKAQMVKNSVIVPVGSKGGFVVKHPLIGATRDELFEQGRDCYKIYLSGLLDITDNIINGKIIPPKEVVRHDDDDPYLVVAADKGTATFSDTANEVAQSYDFWLDDAFASGGSVGYDHKKMGITARGAWVSVMRHFMEMGVDCQKEDFTCVGIGDMGGDVFGNGMLLSKHIRLVGAFNHMHIFIDPEPESASSYKERNRLFKLPRSSWEDYNKDLISKGGGIFQRSAKIINISAQMKKAFNIQESTLAPDDLIKKLLTANVDLLWNGGIGTYVKAERESTESVGDKANDNLRIDGIELRCKIIGEGGNLGFTQLGRIEFAKNGGRINTDAIDNSAGVDCSDHEVNIKIALRKAMENGKITLPQRNKILESMTDEVAKLVLRDNELQTQAITLAHISGERVLEKESRLMHQLEEKGLLNRKIEFLPDDEALAIRQANGKGLERPEISVTLAYAKLDLYEELLASSLPNDDYFVNDLILYFPEAMRKKFLDEIESHELRKEIIATSVCNSIVNRMGSTYFQRMKENSGMKGCDIARGYTIARDAFHVRDLWRDIEALDGKITPETKTNLFYETERLIERTSNWFLRNFAHPLDVSAIIKEFDAGIQELSCCLDDILSPTIIEVRNEKLNNFVEEGVPKQLAKRVANLGVLSSACDVVNVAKGSKLTLRIVGEAYYLLGARMDLGWLRYKAQLLLSHSHWENLAIDTMVETMFDQQMRITNEVIKSAKKNDCCIEALENWYKKNEKSLERYDYFMADLKRQEVITSSMLTIAIQRIQAVCDGY